MHPTRQWTRRHVYALPGGLVLHWRMPTPPDENAVLRDPASLTRVKPAQAKQLLLAPLPDDFERCWDGAVVLHLGMGRGCDTPLTSIRVPHAGTTLDILRGIHSMITAPATPQLLTQLKSSSGDFQPFIAAAEARLAAAAGRGPGSRPQQPGAAATAGITKQQQMGPVTVAELLGSMQYYEGLRSKGSSPGHYEVLAATSDVLRLHSLHSNTRLPAALGHQLLPAAGGRTAAVPAAADDSPASRHSRDQSAAVGGASSSGHGDDYGGSSFLQQLLQADCPIVQISTGTIADLSRPSLVQVASADQGGTAAVFSVVQLNKCSRRGCANLGRMACPACGRVVFCCQLCQQAAGAAHAEDCAIWRVGRD